MENLFNLDDLWAFVINVLTERHPLFLLWVAGTGAIVVGLTQALKKWKPTLQGNLVQSISAGISLVVSAGEAWIGGVFKDGFQSSDGEGIFFLAVAGWMAATWGYAVVTNRNRPADASQVRSGGVSP